MNIRFSLKTKMYLSSTMRVLTLIAMVVNAVAFPMTGALAQSGDDNLISYWNFEEGSGSTAGDTSPAGYGNTGTLINDPGWVSSPFGSALSFDANSDQYVSTLNNSDSLSIPSGGITITAWINASDVSGVKNILAKDKEATTSRGNYSLAVVDGVLRFGFSQASDYGDNWIDTQTSISPNRWYFVAVTHTFGNSATTAIYIDGVSQPLSGWQCDWGCNPDSAPATFPDPLYIGKSICNGENFDGLIDEIKIYNRVLGPEEIVFTPLTQPTLFVRPTRDWVDGWDWIPGETITLSIDDPNTGPGADYSITEMITSSELNFRIGDFYDIKPDDIVTVYGDGSDITKEHVVTHVSITQVDLDSQTIFGSASPNARVDVDVNYGCTTTVYSDGDGDWEVDFTGLCDINPGAELHAREWDDDNDSTQIDYYIIQPVVWAHPNDSSEDWIDVRDWNFGDTVYLTIDDDNDPLNGTLYTDSGNIGPADWNPSVGVKEFRLGDFDLQPGHFVTVTGATATKELLITDINLTEINLQSGTISGTAEPGSAVQAWQHEEPHCNDEVFADGGGAWTVDFSQCNFGPGVGGGVGQKDADEDSTVYFWWVSNPTFGVRANEDRIEGWEWEEGVTLTITVDDPLTAETNPDYTGTATVGVADWDPSQTRFGLNTEGYDLKTGDIVTVSYGGVAKSHTVTSLEFTDVDVDNDLVTGNAASGSQVDVWACDNEGNCVDRHVQVTGDTWTVDFGNSSDEQNNFNIVPGTWIDSSQSDDDGDSTMFGWNVPNPRIEAAPYGGWINGRQWPLGTDITMEIDDPSDGIGENDSNPVDYSATATMEQAPWNPDDPNDIVGLFDWPDQFDPGPGYIITMSGDGLTKTLTVSQLYVTDFNLEADTISGTGTPGAQIQVCANIPGNCITRWVTADDSVDGNWTVNYHDLGTGNDDPDTFDVQLGSNGWAAEYDEDSDQTWFDWHVSSPHFTVYPEWNSVEAWDWPEGVMVTASVSGKSECTVSGIAEYPEWDPSTTNVWMDFPEGCDIETDDLMILSPGDANTQHVVRNLAVTNVDADANMVTGMADPDEVVYVWPHEDGGYELQPTADGAGIWQADFTTVGYDVQPGTNGGRSEVRDENGNSTAVDWNVPSYTLHAVPSHPEIHGHEWDSGSDVTLIVDDDTDPDNGTLYEATRNVDDDPWCGEPCFDLSGVFDLQVGQYVTMADGSISRTVQVSILTVTEIDYVNDVLRGEADARSTVQVNIWSQDGISRTVQADDQNEWMVDFSVPGDGGNEMVADIQPGDWGRAIQLNSDGSDDGTLEYWNAGSSISGTVYLPDASPVGGVLVEACTPENFCRTTLTDGGGNYWLNGLMAGSYTIRAIPPGTNLPGTLGPIDVSYDEDLVGLDITVQEPPSPPPSPDAVEPSRDGGGTISVFIGDPLTLTTYGDPGGAAAFEILVLDDGYVRSGSMNETPVGSGTYTAVIAPLEPHHGAARITYTITYLDKDPVEKQFFIYIDPSGVVQTVGGVPIVGATVTLLRSDNPEGPFEVVPDGSTIMSPSNRTNPDTTDVNGRFGWDVVAGFYKVRAEYPGLCSSIESEVLTIPPPVTDLVLKLDCPNLPPVANAGPDMGIYEGDTVTLDASASYDPEADSLTYEWDLNNDGEYNDAVGESTEVTFPDNGIFTYGLRVTDDGGLTAEDTVTITVLNVAPTIYPLTVPEGPVQLGTLVSVSADFSDPGTADTFTATWNWDDGETSEGAITDHSVSGSHLYDLPGVYTLRLTVTDDDGGVTTYIHQYVVIYDPDGGFVTGGGWFYDPDSGNKANFGFNPKYNKDGTLKGETEFKLNGMKFKSTSHDWMVINSSKGIFIGSGTVNGSGEYVILISVIDGDEAGGVDKIRIILWNEMTGKTVYDSAPGEPEFVDPTMPIGGGSIVVHKAK